MPAPLVTAVIIAALAYIVWAPLERALVAYVAVIVLLPGALTLPNALLAVLTLHRLAILALGLRVVIAVRRRETSVDALRPTAVHAVFFIFVAVTLVNGVLLAAPLTSTTAAVNTWLNVVDQFLVFVVVVAVLRALPDLRGVVKAFAAIVGISAVIAIFERITGTSWSRLVLENMPGTGHSLNAIPLEVRGGGRVRVAAEFGLEYGWMATMALPIVAVVALKAKSWRYRFAPLLLLLAIYWANSRSTLPGLAVVLAVVVIFGGNKRATVIGLIGLALGALLWFGVPSIRAPFEGYRQTGSTQIRSQRLPEITDIIRHRPYQGLGFNGLDPLGFPTTDASYLLLYAELGVIGVASFVALMAVLLAYVAPGLFGPSPWQRLVAAAAVAGVIGGVMGGFAFDLFSVPGSANLFWIIAALAVVLAERDPVRRPRARWSSRRAAGVLVGVVLGITIGVAAPSHADVVTPFDALPGSLAVSAQNNQVFVGRYWRNTVCGIAKSVRLPSSMNVDCVDTSKAPGFGQLRVDAPTLSEARTGMRTITAAVQYRLPQVTFHASSEESGRPTWARTAPVWAPLGAFLICMFWPVRVPTEEGDSLPRHKDLAVHA